MTLAAYVAAQAWPEQPIYSHLHRHGVCSDLCTRMEDIGSPDHARCIEHLRSLNPVHIARIVAKGKVARAECPEASGASVRS